MGFYKHSELDQQNREREREMTTRGGRRNSPGRSSIEAPDRTLASSLVLPSTLSFLRLMYSPWRNFTSGKNKTAAGMILPINKRYLGQRHFYFIYFPATVKPGYFYFIYLSATVVPGHFYFIYLSAIVEPMHFYSRYFLAIMEQWLFYFKFPCIMK